jgi:hypothetical protein
MEGSSDIRRRNNHDEFLLVGIVEDVISVSMEELLLLPPGVPSGFNLLRVVLHCHRL